MAWSAGRITDRAAVMMPRPLRAAAAAIGVFALIATTTPELSEAQQADQVDVRIRVGDQRDTLVLPDGTMLDSDGNVIPPGSEAAEGDTSASVVDGTDEHGTDPALVIPQDGPEVELPEAPGPNQGDDGPGSIEDGPPQSELGSGENGIDPMAEATGDTAADPAGDGADPDATNGDGEPEVQPELTPEQQAAQEARQAELAEATRAYGRIQGEMRSAFEALAQFTEDLTGAERRLARANQRLTAAETHLAETTEARYRANHSWIVAGKRASIARSEMTRSATGAYRSAPGADTAVMTMLMDGDLQKSRTAGIYRSSLLDHLDEVARETAETLDTATARLAATRADAEDALDRRDAARVERNDFREERDILLAFVAAGTEEFERLSAEANNFGYTRAQMAAQAVGERADLDGIGQLLAWAQSAQPDWDFTAPPLFAPLENMVMTSPYGERFHPVHRTWRLHRGVDYGAPTGTPVMATADGVIFLAESRGGYGKTVVIDHGNSLATVNAHLSAYNVVAGDEVKVGDVIGFIGSTGVSTGPHLHFETRLKGAAVQPLAFGLIDPDEIGNRRATETIEVGGVGGGSDDEASTTGR